MPVAHFHLTACTDAQLRHLLTDATARYAAILESPVDRVRIFVHRLDPSEFAIGGVPVGESGRQAPYFEALMMRGRPPQKRTELLATLTDVLVEVLGVDRDGVRGLVTEIDPDGWGIAGVPASVVRAGEIAARAQQNS